MSPPVSAGVHSIALWLTEVDRVDIRYQFNDFRTSIGLPARSKGIEITLDENRVVAWDSEGIQLEFTCHNGHWCYSQMEA